MYRIFTWVVVVAIIPFSKKITGPDLIASNAFSEQAYVFPYKNTIDYNPFEPEKRSAESWSKGWMTGVQENIRNSEYYFKWEDKYKAYCTPNRKNNLRFFYSDKGFTVEPRTTQIAIDGLDPVKRPDEIKYKSIPNWKVKFNLDKKQVGKGIWTVADNKAEYVTKNITVQYINNDEGMRQNFIVHSPLSKNNKLKINFRIKTKLRTYLQDNRLQFFHKKKNVLNYEQLKVWDANGKPLNAFIKKNKRNRFYIQVDTKDAVYPITVDPISTTPAAIIESNQVGAALGFAVASAGDVNGDGYSDIIVGAPGYTHFGLDEGAAFIYHGSATGINTTAAAFVANYQDTSSYGVAVASAGDVNGDGYSDVIVGAPFYDNGEQNEGAFYVYHGSPAGINTTPVALVESNQALAQLSFSVTGAGDVNGDGYSDVIAGAWLFDDVEVNEGVAFVYQGSGTGINTAAPVLLQQNQAGSNYGIAVAGAGDVNGDGFSDVIVGAEDYDNGNTDEGAVFLYYGSAGGINNVAASSVEGQQDLCQFGFSVSTAGDVNGDGYSDVLVGAYLYDNGDINEGAAFIYHGSPGGISNVPTAIVESNQPGANLGASVACAGDINGDGYSDIITGANFYDNVENNEGAAFVFMGSSIGVNVIAAAILESNQANAGMGRGVASAGDVNGDGYSDVIVGAYQYDNPESNEGGAFVYHGSAAGLSTTPNSTPDDADQTIAFFGGSVASAGDVNGDGFSDVIIGANNYDDGPWIDEGRAFVYYGSAAGLSASPNSILDDADQEQAHFGNSVASAGDVNGDGYSDVIIGAYFFDDGPVTNEGVAFVYYGSAAGLSASPNSILDDANQADGFFGSSVAAAGDVNGDGYGDVIIGARYFDDGANTDEGVAFVYHGSATGLSSTPNNTPDDADQAGAEFGISVAAAGDVNGDGYSDVIIGAHFYNDAANTDEGRAFVYHGSATGLSGIPDSTPDDADQPSAFFGRSVASAGDINGDGYSDVIIGANAYDDGASANEGVAFVYHGSAAGLSATPNSTPDDADQADARFGWIVAPAGDVNGDGYSDVIVGAYAYDDGASVNEGRAFLYYGSATGLSATPNSTPDDGDVANLQFATIVACAGDVNGDGYSDVIIGAPLYVDGPNINEGRAFLYNGNEFTTNKRNNLRMYNSDLTTPINSSNFVIGNFGAGLFARSFLGRDKAKMVWETRLNYNAYSGNPITNSTLFTAQQSGYTDLGSTGVELKNIIDKLLGSGSYTKLRVRVKYNPATAITGQVYGPWRNASGIIDGNSLGALPVELVSFDAVWLQKGKTAKLSFTTDKENGICCFDILKSSDGFNFYSIGTLPAKNIPGKQSYIFIDNNAIAKNQFYRLKIKGDNGKTEYSNIQQLQNNGATEILVFPNPTTGVLQLQLNGVYDKINVQVINSAGQVVKQFNGLSATNQTLTIPVHNLPSGQYLLLLQTGAEKQVLQFLKQ